MTLPVSLPIDRRRSAATAAVSLGAAVGVAFIAFAVCAYLRPIG